MSEIVEKKKGGQTGPFESRESKTYIVVAVVFCSRHLARVQRLLVSVFGRRNERRCWTIGKRRNSRAVSVTLVP